MSKNKELVKILADLLVANAYVAYSNVLGIHQSSRQDHYLERCRSPEVGDLVLELSSVNHSINSLDRIGRLLEIKENNNVFDRVYKIELLDGRIMEWSNSDFITVPEHPFRHQMKESDRLQVRK